MKKLKLFFFIIAIFQFSSLSYGQTRKAKVSKAGQVTVNMNYISLDRKFRKDLNPADHHGGFLTNNELPNSVRILPPPPKEGSAAFKEDERLAPEVFNKTSQGRLDTAMSDAVTFFPATLEPLKQSFP